MALIFAAAFGRIFPHAIRAVREGIGVTQARNALRVGGLRFSNQAYSQAHAMATRIASIRRAEVGANLASRPGATRIARGPWGFTQKWGQVARLQLRDAGTGLIHDWNVTMTTDRLRTRQGAIDAALELVLPSLEEYGEELVGALYDHTKGRA